MHVACPLAFQSLVGTPGPAGGLVEEEELDVGAEVGAEAGPGAPSGPNAFGAGAGPLALVERRSVGTSLLFSCVRATMDGEEEEENE